MRSAFVRINLRRKGGRGGGFAGFQYQGIGCFLHTPNQLSCNQENFDFCVVFLQDYDSISTLLQAKGHF